jgi:two-component SAPR family response regulator
MKYIIVDPDIQNGVELKKILDEYEVLEFQGSYTAFHAAESDCLKHTPDIAFIRLGKAELNSIKLFSVIRELNPFSKIIFHSSNVEYAVEAFECGADGFLFVPFSREKIVRLFRSWINTKGDHKEKNARRPGHGE